MEELQQYAMVTPILAATGVGGRGLFTAAQWVELQRQALIYSHMAASAPIPSYLLFSVITSNAPPAAASHCSSYTTAAYQAAACCRMSLSSMLLHCMQRRRCRRTDGKKWRCARDAEPDQKYCQRHLHRAAARRSKPSPAKSSKASGGGGLLDLTGGVAAGLPEQRENRLSLDYDTIAEQYQQLYCSKKQAMDEAAASSSCIGGPLGEVLGLNS